MQAATSQGAEPWRSGDGPATSDQDSIKAQYAAVEGKLAESMLELGSEAYDEQQQMEQLNKLLHEEQVWSWLCFIQLAFHSYGKSALLGTCVHDYTMILSRQHNRVWSKSKKFLALCCFKVDNHAAVLCR